MQAVARNSWLVGTNPPVAVHSIRLDTSSSLHAAQEFACPCAHRGSESVQPKARAVLVVKIPGGRGTAKLSRIGFQGKRSATLLPNGADCERGGQYGGSRTAEA